ncbi:hypothetical protein KKC17_00210 [Patescibacteria group bacterium]|nr:hypothetical protein [Patescibacteria group bacterium]
MFGKKIIFWQWRKESWRSFWRQRLVWLPVSLTFLMAISSWLVLWLVLPQQAELSVIRYSVVLGPNWLAEPRYLYLVPVLGTLFMVANVLLAYTLGRRTLFLKQLWLWCGLILTAGWFGLTMLLVWINT